MDNMRLIYFLIAFDSLHSHLGSSSPQRAYYRLKACNQMQFFTLQNFLTVVMNLHDFVSVIYLSLIQCQSSRKQIVNIFIAYYSVPINRVKGYQPNLLCGYLN